MYIRIVTFRLQGMDPDDYEEMAERLAVTFRQWPGLTAKLWLADRETSTFCGVTCSNHGRQPTSHDRHRCSRG